MKIGKGRKGKGSQRSWERKEGLKEKGKTHGEEMDSRNDRK